MTKGSFYPESPHTVQVLETHISWVFLTDRFAYKLKKPVKFDFLDFSTPELRHQACLDELRLNRRLSPKVYLDVLPLSLRTDGGLELAGRGPPVDWVVQMRRLPADKALDRILREGRLAAPEAKLIAELLTSFYALLPSFELSPADYRNAIDRRIRANSNALLSAMPAERAGVRRVHGKQLRYLTIEREAFDARVNDGWIVEGHGDLRPEHIYVESPPVVIDCLEFSRELRTVDIADELSFLAMECKRLGDGGLGELVLETYQRQCGDHTPPRILAFYRAYRACVRAKVAVLRSQQQSQGLHAPADSMICQYLAAADHYASELGGPCVMLVGGLIGTGKSTLANAIAETIGAELLSTDDIRRSLYGASSSDVGYGEGHYQSAMHARVYDAMFNQARRSLQDGLSVILDATFKSRTLRKRAYDLQTRGRAEMLFVQCKCPKAVAMSRIQNRSRIGDSLSEARVEFYELQVRDFENPVDDEPTITVDTSQSLTHQLDAVFSGLRCRLFG
jgi:aminoglycoside phosphotransferase family enzyme/predicted kinase